MSLNDLFYLEPYLWLALGGLAVLLSGLLPSGRTWAFWGSVVVLAGTILGSLELLDQHHSVEGFIFINSFTQSAIIFFSIIALAVILMSQNANTIRQDIDEIYYSLIIFSVMGMALILSENLVALLIGVEMVTICGFALAAWRPERTGAVEAATKYVITAGIATGFILMGIALIYTGSGTVMISAIGNGASTHNGSITLVTGGLFLLLAGIGFELAVAPFHCWLADFYEGAPAPIVAFIGSVAKLAILCWLILLPFWLDPRFWTIVKPTLTGMAIISMIIGTILALRQNNLKRLLAYSSVAHFGFVLVAFAAYQHASPVVISYYGVVYAITTLAAFAVIVGVESGYGFSGLEQCRGLGRRCPMVGVALVLVMLSLAGIPPLAGFFAKLMLFQLAINQGSWFLATIMALSSAAGLYYYIRVLLVVFDKPENRIEQKTEDNKKRGLRLTPNTAVILVFVALTTVMGIFSQPVLDYISAMF